MTRYTLSLWSLNLYVGKIIRYAGLHKSQDGIKTAGRNINNLRYEDGISLIAESEEELNSLLMKVKEKSEKAGLKLDIQTTIHKKNSQYSWHPVPPLHGI